MKLASYEGMQTTGTIRNLIGLSQSLENRHIVIVEDIIDSGHTLSALTKLLRDRKPSSLKVVTFLDKPSRRKVQFEGDYVGFKVPDEFVIGYGLDYDERYRNLPYVGVLSLD